jgi:3'-5' exoribonuclease
VLPQYTTEGKLIGHLTLGVEILLDKINNLPNFPPQLTMALKHMILTHHGNPEWGSPVPFQTAEAIALHFLDNLDAKLAALNEAISRCADPSSIWTDYVPAFERPMFKGLRQLDSLPDQGPDTESPSADATTAGEES